MFDLKKLVKKRLKASPRIIHVVAKNLRANLDQGENLPLVGVRSRSRPEKVILCRHADIHGPSQLYHRPNDQALPGTEGRGVCYLTTDGPLTLYFDKKG